MLKELLDALSEYLRKRHEQRKEDEKQRLQLAKYNQHPWEEENKQDQGDQRDTW